MQGYFSRRFQGLEPVEVHNGQGLKVEDAHLGKGGEIDKTYRAVQDMTLPAFFRVGNCTSDSELLPERVSSRSGFEYRIGQIGYLDTSGHAESPGGGRSGRSTAVIWGISERESVPPNSFRAGGRMSPVSYRCGRM